MIAASPREQRVWAARASALRPDSPIVRVVAARSGTP
jgi:hypothetical protein